MKILFLCTGNSCRSQMAEGFARAMMPTSEVYSAGVAPSRIHPRAIAAMAEVGIDIGSQRSKRPEETPWRELDLVITVCGAARESCPALPSTARTIHWAIDDPAHATGDEAAITDAFRRVREELRQRVRQLAGTAPPASEVSRPT